MQIKAGPLLDNIATSDELKKLDRSQLTQLSSELRQYIIEYCIGIWWSFWC